MGEGKISIMLGPTTYDPRETINGKVKLRLSDKVRGRSLVVEFYGEIVRGNKFERVFRAIQGLGGEQEYKNGDEFPFSLTIPEQALPPAPQGTFGAIHDMFVPKLHSWFIEAKLDLPMAPDIHERISVYMRH
jgi:hypothetical protein